MTTNDFIGNFFIFLKNIYIPLPLKVIKKIFKVENIQTEREGGQTDGQSQFI